ncbi:MAG TPA: hypothetical protein VJH91_00160 [Candidatus Paceibacterota bacterium]
MSYRQPFAIDEWYHCYNRGVDKRKIFQTKADYERFLLLLYVCNGTRAVHVSNLKDRRLHSILSDTTINRGKTLVEIGAYSLMPNHFHLVLKEIQEGGIASFMQKVFTGYTMFFNKKNDRTGALVAGPFKSKHVPNDEYLKHLIAYVHLNSAELFDSAWKKGTGNRQLLEQKLPLYSYCSLPDFLGQKRLENRLIGDSVFSLFESIPTIQEMLQEAGSYYAEVSGEIIKASP